MSILHRASLVVQVDYHQFYITDADDQWLAPEDWTDEDLQFGVKASGNGIVIAPARNMYVPVEVEVFDKQPEINIQNADHVVLCTIDLQTGKLQLQECMGTERLFLTIPKDTYIMAALFFGLSTISEDGLSGDDHYKLMLWPGRSKPLEILKQWSGEWRG